MASAPPLASDSAVCIVLGGHVQGVGFRPFVFRIAVANGLRGRVLNKLGEVEIVVAGNTESVDRFVDQLISKAPPLARPVLQSVEPVAVPDESEFVIAESASGADACIFVPPDYFMCDDCRAELGDPQDRRFRYPFINCTQCGPRYTLIRALPYDRPNTSMAGFPLCEQCRREYEDPTDRRFHAEPVACPDCGPQISFAASAGAGSLFGEDALVAALSALAGGDIVAVKGVGGYHLMCDAGNETAVERLRERKHRPDKPLAVMLPLDGKDGLAAARREVELADVEAEVLRSPARPILSSAGRKSSR